MPSYLSSYLPKCCEFEGSIAWMYLDTRGYVTAGVGFMIPSAATATDFPFRTSDGSIASKYVIAQAWLKVKWMDAGRMPSFYSYPGCLHLSSADINTHLTTILEGVELSLQKAYPKFDTFPDAVKMALMDMSFNLGAGKLEGEYPHFNTAVGAMDWQAAALHCHRLGIGLARNEWCAEQFSLASKADSSTIIA